MCTYVFSVPKAWKYSRSTTEAIRLELGARLELGEFICYAFPKFGVFREGKSREEFENAVFPRKS